MQSSSIPAKFPIPWASSAADPTYARVIPVPSQISITPGAASLTDGFPPATFQPVESGGTPPWGQDMNGILRQITQWSQWAQACAPVFYDNDFSTAIGGYPHGTILASAVFFGNGWLSNIDNNTSNPDAGGANWTLISFQGSMTTGDRKTRPTSESLPGWVRANANTIGNATSNATERANADCANLFAWHWNNFSNTQCPVFTSAGTPTSRGANAAADFAANRRIQLLDYRGYIGVGADSMGNVGGGAGRFSGISFSSGTQFVPGSLFGGNTVTLSMSMIPTFTPSGSVSITDPTHSHNPTDPGHNHPSTLLDHIVFNIAGSLNIQTNAGSGAYAQGGLGNTGTSGTGITINAAPTGISASFSGNSLGSGNPTPNMQLGIIETVYLKL